MSDFRANNWSLASMSAKVIFLNVVMIDSNTPTTPAQISHYNQTQFNSLPPTPVIGFSLHHNQIQLNSLQLSQTLAALWLWVSLTTPRRNQRRSQSSSCAVIGIWQDRKDPESLKLTSSTLVMTPPSSRCFHSAAVSISRWRTQLKCVLVAARPN